MKSMICVLTWNRRPALETMLAGLREHCPGYPINIFEDCGNRDGTAELLTCGPGRDCPELLAVRHELAPGMAAYLGSSNLGVAGNSNRALKVFMDSDCDHLLLCNDDLHVRGDFAAFYAQAHLDLGPGMFLFTDFWESPTHRWTTVRSRGYRVKLAQRMTGIMMSVLRRTVDKAGYFDANFGKFGEDHCEWTNRIRMAGELKLDGLDQACLDVEPSLPNGDAAPPVLRHQAVASSMQGEERVRADAEAVLCMQRAVARYATEHYYRPFQLRPLTHIGGVGDQGIKVEEAGGYLRS